MRGPIFFAVIGDIVGSRDLEDRGAVQRRLQASLARSNERWREVIAADLKLTAGDEVQGLLRGPSVVVDIMTETADAIHPARMVWGLGRGPLSTELAADVAVLDGPCLHNAREALRAASQRGRWLDVRGVGAPHGEAVAALMSLIGAIRSDWTETRLAYIREARVKPQKDVAAQFGVNESTVSRALARARFRPVLEAEAATRSLLESAAAEARD